MDAPIWPPQTPIAPPANSRRKHLGVWLGLGVVVAAMAYGASYNQPAAGSASASNTHTVTCKLGGTARSADITYSNADGGTSQQSTVDVPLTRKSDGGEGIQFQATEGQFLYISAQNHGEYGDITCTIEVDGIPMKTSRSSGAYTIATCSGRL